MTKIDRALSPEERAALLRMDFVSFVKASFPKVSPGITLIWAPYLTLLCARLQAVAEGQIQRLIVTIPPRHLKSFTVSVALPAFYLGHDPEKEVMVVSYGADLARKFGEDTQTLMNSDFYTELFGPVLKSRRQPPVALKTVSNGIRRATSIDGVATGVGGDLIIFDDPQKPNEVLSEAIRRATNDAYQNTFLSRRNNPSASSVIIVMQRLHEDDFVAHALAHDSGWEVINLPALAEEDERIPFHTPLGAGVFRRLEGEPLHPRRLPLSALEQIRASVGEATWATQYQQRPAPAGGGLVKIDWFKRYREDDLPGSFDRKFQSWDTANTAEQRSDYSVCTTWGVKDKNVYLLHVFRARLLFPDLKRAVTQQAVLHDVDEVFVEDHASGTQILQDLHYEGFGKLRAIKATRDKRTRMVNQSAIIENGRVLVPEEAPWLVEYLYELSVFPNGKFDDQVDSTSQALDQVTTPPAYWAIAEFYRQESERLTTRREETWTVQPAPGSGQFYGRDGTLYQPDSQGQYRLPVEDAKCALRIVGWSRVEQP